MFNLGIDLGGTNIAVGIVDDSLKIVRKGSVKTLAKREPDQIVRDMAALCSSLLEAEGIPLSEVRSVGISTPGSVDKEKGLVAYANNLPFTQYPIADTFRSFLPVSEVLLENDANAAALAEAVVGAGRGLRYVLMITLGTGLGGGIVLDGKVYSGFNGAGAEFGHMVIRAGGRPCTCGRKGCWETYSSATGLSKTTREMLAEYLRIGRKTMLYRMTGGDVRRCDARMAFAAMKQGDQPAAEIVESYITDLACGVTNIINLFQPDILVIGGGVCGEGDYLLVPLREKVHAEVYSKDPTPQTRIEVAQLGNDAGIIGGAMLSSHR